MPNIPIINIYAQESEHDDARIVCNREGLLTLSEAITRTMARLEIGAHSTEITVTIFASDGEGYYLRIECHEDWSGEAPQ